MRVVLSTKNLAFGRALMTPTAGRTCGGSASGKQYTSSLHCAAEKGRLIDYTETVTALLNEQPELIVRSEFIPPVSRAAGIARHVTARRWPLQRKALL